MAGEQGTTNDDLARLIISMREDLNRRFEQLQSTVASDLKDIAERVEKLEKMEFDPARTIVFPKLVPTNGLTDHQLINDILRDAGLTNTVDVRNVKRVGRQGHGVVQCELDTIEQKIQCLQQKVTVKQVCGSHIRTAKTHTELVNEQNFKTLLDLLPGGSDYRLTANGKITKKGVDLWSG